MSEGRATVGGAAALAGEAWLLVIAEPTTARRLAKEALALTAIEPDPVAASVAHRALGMAALELDDSGTSIDHLRHAIAAGRAAEQDALVAEAEMSLALALQHRGEARAALRHAGAAHALAPHSARLGLQRALLLERMGRTDDALAAYDETEGLAAAIVDRHTLVRMHCNRGVLLTYGGRFAEAERDLLLAEGLCTELGLGAMAAGVRSNLGFLAARRGDLVEALRRLEADRAEMRAFGGLRSGTHDLDHAEVLLLAGLPRDAAAAGKAAIAAFGAAAMHAEAAEARVLAAQATLRAGDAEGALTLAQEAATMLARQRRRPWLALAREVEVRALAAAGRRDAALLDRARRAAGALDEAGWKAAAASARLLAAQLALELGRPAAARTQLQRASAERTGPVGVRVQARHADALLRLLQGNRRGALAALRAGWSVLEGHRATLTATELRVGAGAHAAPLTALGVQLAIEAADPVAAFVWAERGRAGALLRPPAQAPQGTPLAEALDALRTTVADLDAAAKAGRDTATLLRRQTSLEADVRRRAQLAADAGGTDGSPGLGPSGIAPAALLAALGERTSLVEFIADGDALHAVVAADGRLTLHALGSVTDAARETAALRMALGRMARAGAPAPLLAAATAAAELAAARLSDQLVRPLSARIRREAVVLVPTGALHGLPWAALPGLPAEQSVAPSATLWARGAPRSPVAPRARRVLLAAGPGLAHADRELDEIAALYPGAQAGHAAQTTADDVRAMLPHVDLAHLACHGRFRGDNPQFSALDLTGGQLSVFELERLPRVPERLVLSACDAGVSAVHPGDELLGLTAALLQLGAQNLVASVLPVPDGATRRLMVALHRELAAGAAPAAALAAARSAADPQAPDDRAAAAAFQAFGSA